MHNEKIPYLFHISNKYGTFSFDYHLINERDEMVLSDQICWDKDENKNGQQDEPENEHSLSEY